MHPFITCENADPSGFFLIVFYFYVCMNVCIYLFIYLFCISRHVLISVYCFSHSRNEHCCSTSTKKELSLDVLHMSLAKHCRPRMPVFFPLCLTFTKPSGKLSFCQLELDPCCLCSIFLLANGRWSSGLLACALKRDFNPTDLTIWGFCDRTEM